MTSTELNQEIFDGIVSTLSSKGARRTKVVFTTVDGKEITFASKAKDNNNNNFSGILSIDDYGVNSYVDYSENPIPERSSDKNKYITKHEFVNLPFSYIYTYKFEYETQRVETIVQEE